MPRIAPAQGLKRLYNRRHRSRTLGGAQEVVFPVSFFSGRKMDWDMFVTGFWHPFGDHGAHPDGRIETADEVLRRKTREIEGTPGWTLWSFQYRRDLDCLLTVIEQARPPRVYALCTHSTSTVAPRGEVRPCRQYRLARTEEWRDIPDTICVPHPINDGQYACTFKVQSIIELAPHNRSPALHIQWYSTKTSVWSCIFPSKNDPQIRAYPPRPETLIRRYDGGAPLRPVRAVLELAHTYLGTLRG
jgi:hypothetical protein